LFEAGYYFFKISECCNNLRSLKIDGSIIPYSIIRNLGVLFPNLESVKLEDVLLIDFRTENAHSEDRVFPANLNYLEISRVKVIELEDSSNPHQVRFDDFTSQFSNTFILPKISIPSLKILNLEHYENETDNGLETFLDFNPNLELLKIDILELDRAYNFNSLNILVPEYLYYHPEKLNLPIQEGVKEIIFSIEMEEDFESVTKLCGLCPNLEKLQFRISGFGISYQQSFDSFLIPILSKLPKLRTLDLKICTGKDDILDINEFAHIETIVFYSNMNLISNLKNIEIF
jgi:hypothetical protein